ncbi:MAG: propionate--CoA ligase [Pseudomonadota bacterium]
MTHQHSVSGDYDAFHRRSMAERDAFWAEQAELIDWRIRPATVCDDSDPLRARWYAGGMTNLCHNAVDRHLARRAGQPALICVSSETGLERSYSYAELHREVQRMAAVLLELGVAEGDRVLIYLPMIAEAAFAMLACARIGAIHSVVFGGFASAALAARIDDARPQVIVSADAGSRAGKVLPYKPMLDEALAMAAHRPRAVLLVDRQLAPMPLLAGRDHVYGPLRQRHADAVVPCQWLESGAPSYILYTSGTTGRPKGVQRDTGGYAVALAASMRHIFSGEAGGTFFSTSDIGWVVGHSYIVYGPLLAGMATILYEGTPTRPDAAVWWRLVERYRVTAMFSAPTALRVLRREDPAHLSRHDLSSLRALYLAGEPLDESTSEWIAQALRIPVIDNYWQTETGWPVLATALGAGMQAGPMGCAGKAMYGYDVKLLDESSGEEVTGAGRKGLLVIAAPLPPGCMQTVWGDDARYRDTYWQVTRGKAYYSTFDWAIRDEHGYYRILGRADDVINVAGHRLGTREIEESIAGHPQVAEVAVVGVADRIKGQVAVAFVVLAPVQAQTQTQGTQGGHAQLQLQTHLRELVSQRLGAVARPERVLFVPTLPKTRSGKLLRRALQALCEGRDTGDLSTMEDQAPLHAIRAALAAGQG